jgi:uncharacterized OsmC-like protein
LQARATIRPIEGKQLLGHARHHAVVTDRPADDGGTDLGFTSGELLLLAIGSCSTGSLRRFLEERGLPRAVVQADVFFAPPARPGERDRIVIELQLDTQALPVGADAIRKAAVAGRVASRVSLGSDIEVRIVAV